MALEFVIKKCVAWAKDLTRETDWQAFSVQEKSLSFNSPLTKEHLPALKQIPAMQRRRLSPFAKISLHCALEAGEGFLTTVPCVFASRHGDLAKTSKLIMDVANKEDLSPTHFGLSVHNAVGGLFSIFTENKAALTAISAGEDTFFTAIVDAVSKLNTYDYERILVVYTDEVVPEMYQGYVQQDEVSVSVALLIEKAPKIVSENVTASFNLTLKPAAKGEQENTRMQAIDFLSFYHSDIKNIEIKSRRHIWSLSKNS